MAVFGVRHNELAAEMVRRGYNHNSPYEQPNLSYLKPNERYAEIDTNVSILDLALRCVDCANNLKNR